MVVGGRKKEGGWGCEFFISPRTEGAVTTVDGRSAVVATHPHAVTDWLANKVLRQPRQLSTAGLLSLPVDRLARDRGQEVW